MRVWAREPTPVRILLSAYACEPGTGSEPAVGWNLALELAEAHDVVVLTRANNRATVQRYLEANPSDRHPHFVYVDLPPWLRFWKRGGRGVQLYYYLWQLWAIPAARREHRRSPFDILHHVTFVRYWAPSCLAFVGAPFVWGPVGGGEDVPAGLYERMPPDARRFERLRNLARWLGEHDPLVRLTARRSAVALATTDQTADRLRRIGARRIHVVSQVGLSNDDVAQLRGSAKATGGFHLVSLGNLIYWKGHELALRAFARAAVEGATYTLVGDGPERRRLEDLARELGVADAVSITGRLPRAQALDLLLRSDALLHPSLHDSGGFACLEAMGAGKPVLYLNVGGPAVIVGGVAGIAIDAREPGQVIDDLAATICRLVTQPGLAAALGDAGRRRVREEFMWSRVARRLGDEYAGLASSHG